MRRNYSDQSSGDQTSGDQTSSDQTSAYQRATPVCCFAATRALLARTTPVRRAI